MSVKIILLDLDGTLLTSDKTISPANYAALARAADMGVHIVPSTGRFYDAMPAVVRELPFVRYAVTVNGAQIYDAREKKVLHQAEISSEEALAAYEYFASLPTICDCYVEGWGYMERSHYARIDEFCCTAPPYVEKMLKELRTPVDDVKEIIRTHKVQKVMCFFKDMDRRAVELERIPVLFPNLRMTSSIANNIEVNAMGANKGDALKHLCAHLGVDIKDTMAFGDGSNDLTMIQTAGIGVAMGNAYQDLKDAADYVTLDCDADGVAHAIEKFVF